MSRTSIPEKVKCFLWGKAAGRCEYRGCNKKLFEDPIKKRPHNIGYHAHIIASSENGPRGHKELSDALGKDISNIMLLCDSCHRRIDQTEKIAHGINILKEMKLEHEQRIELLGEIQEDSASHILLYGANIGNHHSPLNYDNAAFALSKNKYYPAEDKAIELSLKNSCFKDHDLSFWNIEVKHLRSIFDKKVKPYLEDGSIKILSVFALAPQPLLIELGRLLGDIYTIQTYQLSREPKGWAWQNKSVENSYKIIRPPTASKIVALNMSLSATITNERIKKILGNNVSIWTITHDNPNNDFIKTENQVENFRKEMRKLFDEIKKCHGQGIPVHVFPAIPVSLAVDMGRVWMPKADSPLIIYDQNNQAKSFIKVHTIE